MFKLLQPDYYYQDIFSINLKRLQEEGISGIICDIDNTIVPWSERKIIIEVKDWILKIQDMGFLVCLVSNGMDKRVNYFSEELNIPAVGQAVKPRKKAYLKAKRILNLNNDEIVVIGDQIFTDILGGNRLDFTTVLVDPMDKKEFITTRFLRMIEGLVFNRGEYG